MDELDRIEAEFREAIEEMHADHPAFRDFCLQLLEQQVERVRREDERSSEPPH